MADYRNTIQMCARTDQYMLQPGALQRLADFLSETSSDEVTALRMIKDLFKALKKEPLTDRFVSETVMNETIQKQIRTIRGALDSRDSTSQVLVVSLAQVPKVFIDEVSGDIGVGSPGVGAEDRLHVLRARYLLARRRCLRSGIYRADMKQRLAEDRLLPLAPTTALEGLTPDVEVAVLGLLTVKGSEVLLEDLFSQVVLKPQAGLEFARNSFVGEGMLVVVVGRWRNAAVHVSRIELPPGEKREKTLAEVGPSVDLFGLAPADASMALVAEKSALRSVILFLSHVHLDTPATLTNLASFFRRMQERSDQELADTTFVLAGNFSSAPLRYGDASHLPNTFDGADNLHMLFDRLATCIATSAPTVAQQSHFILIPGPHDLSVLQGFQPQFPIGSRFVKELKAKLRRVTLAPNPCRLRFHTHEMVVARRDFLRAFQEREHSFPWTPAGSTATGVDVPQNGGEEAQGNEAARSSLTSFERIAKTVIDEAHLAPEQACTLWKQDDALRLPVLPHTLLLCDSTEEWECHYKGVHVVNPGSFAVNTTFLWYTPADGECNLSSLE